MFLSPLLTGLLAILGALCYAIGDVLMLADKPQIADYPNLQPHLKLLSGMELMVALSWPRLMWGGLVAVFATPLLLASSWTLYAGLETADAWWVWPPLLLFALGFIYAPFVHGSFIFMGQCVQALNQFQAEAQPPLLKMYQQLRQLVITTYAPLILCVIAASVWFSLAVVFGRTHYPVWVAAFNPVTLTLVWLGLRKVAPQLTVPLQGAGFNIAFMAFFALITFTLP